jgi:aryl-alcohol dehydrogenase-like predicted oxidoreductase
MKQRKLGKTGLNVAPITFGGNVFGWTLDTPASMRILDSLADNGLNFIDTADAYSTWVPGNSGGESERILGKWFKQSGKRDKVVLATKVGHPTTGLPGGLKADYIVKAVDASLQRLNTDYIDLYQAHKDDASTPLEETLGAFDKLVKAGKVRAIGASNYSAARLTQALDVSKANGLAAFATLQPQYNLYDRRDFEAELEQCCLDNDIAVINYYSLASGFLSGKYRTEADTKDSARGARVKNYLDARGLRVLEALDAVAAQYRSSPASVALAWLLNRPAVTAPIASATSDKQLAALVEATRLELSKEAIEVLDRASAY